MFDNPNIENLLIFLFECLVYIIFDVLVTLPLLDVIEWSCLVSHKGFEVRTSRTLRLQRLMRTQDSSRNSLLRTDRPGPKRL